MLVVARASNPRWARMRAVPASQGLGMMNAEFRACSARNACPFSACVRMLMLVRSAKRRRHAKGSIHDLDEISLFAKDEALRLGHLKIRARFLVGPQTLLVVLVRCEAVKSNQAPAYVIRAFVRKEVSDEMPSAAGNDTAPIFGILLEILPLKRINLVSNEACDGHWWSPSEEMGPVTRGAQSPRVAESTRSASRRVIS